MNQLWIVLGISVFGGLGALARSVQDTLVKDRFGSEFPRGTMAINIGGSFLLGVITGMVVTAEEPGPWAVVVGAGFCGGYTTFSTAMFEAAVLLREQRWRAATASVVGTLGATVVAAGVGLWLGAR
ncbi:protein CrcB homolog [Gordonia hirsuta DSM 44140 = NBRC 16056]|uniref:Fluoride-specific ion channel FluC n=1 Tax=Gordonia hirsuta DSM 44140 = NBRC 16056 TaxID=1121927 RepID=L7LAL8_9ACTN|nr:CrcB family protein [Gordonia hirsuta]GAC57063.1 protein CrcB homolog [Gordonia hirsuta DSM 44140 = NBRC 16056]